MSVMISQRSPPTKSTAPLGLPRCLPYPKNGFLLLMWHMRKRVRLSETLLSIVASRSDQSDFSSKSVAHAKSICALRPVSALTPVSMYCVPVASMYSRNASGSAVSVSPLAQAAKPTAAANIASVFICILSSFYSLAR